MSTHEDAIRPVFFEAQNDEYPYWGFGSSLLAFNEGNYFWITAKHVMNNQGQSYDELRVFPSDISKMSIPFNAMHRIIPDDPEEEFADIYILRIDLDMFSSTGDAFITAYDLSNGTLSPDHLSTGDDLIVVGYPEEDRYDYGQFRIECRRKVFPAIYVGKTPQRYWHQLKITDNLGLSEFNSLSGSAVFRIVTLGSLMIPMYVGLLNRAVATTGVGNFISSQVIVAATKA